MKTRYKILLPALAVAAATTAWYVNRTPASPFDGVAAPAFTPALVRQGEQLARAAD